MLTPLNAAIRFEGAFTSNRTGKTGLTVAVTVYRNGTAVVTGAAATEVGNGLYTYTLAAGSVTAAGLYDAVFTTTDTTVDMQIAYDQVRAGEPHVERVLTALPNVAAAANGGLPTVDGTNGVLLRALESLVQHSGTAQGGGATTITLAAAASATNDLYKGSIIKIHGGTGAGQTRVVIGYVGLTKVVTVGRAWAVNPDATSQYAVLADSTVAVDNNLAVTANAVNGNVTGSIGSVADRTGFALTAAERTAIRDAGYLTGDAFARIGLNGAGLTALGDTRLDTIAGYTDTLESVIATLQGVVNTINTNTDTVESTQAAIAGAIIALQSSVNGIPSATRTALGSSTINLISSVIGGNLIEIVRGDALSFNVHDLGPLAVGQKIWWTVKSDENHSDAQSIIQIERTIGLAVLNAAPPVAPVVPADGIVTVTDAATGAATITLAARATALLAPTSGALLRYDVQILDSGGVPRTKARGRVKVQPDITHALS